MCLIQFKNIQDFTHSLMERRALGVLKNGVSFGEMSAVFLSNTALAQVSLAFKMLACKRVDLYFIFSDLLCIATDRGVGRVAINNKTSKFH